MLEETKITDEQKKIISSYCLTFNSEHGQKVLQDMIDSYMGQTYVRADSHHSAFNEGERAVVLGILDLLRIGNTGQTTEITVESEGGEDNG